ncbi:MAG: C4-type zinc ribbon domain-containing protein [Prevotella sp.]|nr:C4-type zinc ribbon domain-containing protein [Prevotella sp.]MCM1075276.1 C4-type zinc ribbon domain-containing protein [Ruminococcus sp.]
MATEKKVEKERSVEERLKSLYELQTIFSEIDRIKTLRGELPNEVKDLEDNIARFQTRIQKFKDEIARLKKQILQKSGEIKDREAKIERYRQQQDNVRNNREYDFLSKEIEFEGLEIELAEKNIREYNSAQEARLADIAQAEEELADGEHILAEKRAELADIVSETKAEEENLRQKALELESLIDAYTLAAFKRIRKNARNGLGIVTVQRNACGGCFNRIPPQRQLEIKMHKKIIVCEYCGRIMLDGKLAGLPDPEPEAPTPKKRASRKTVKPKAEAEPKEEA